MKQCSKEQELLCCCHELLKSFHQGVEPFCHVVPMSFQIRKASAITRSYTHSYGWKVEYNEGAIKHHQQFSHRVKKHSGKLRFLKNGLLYF